MIGFGIIGTGRDALDFYMANRHNKDCSLAAVCGRTIEEAQAFAAGKQGMQAFGEPDDLASCREVEAVYISGFADSHYDLCKKMLEAGKHVLCRNCLADGPEDTGALFDLAEEKGLILMEASPVLCSRGYLEMKNHAGTLGKLRRAVLVSSCRQEEGAGALACAGAEPVAMLADLFGSPLCVRAAGTFYGGEEKAAGTISLVYEDLLADVLFSGLTDSRMHSEIQGEDAVMLIGSLPNIKDLQIHRGRVKQNLRYEQSDNLLRPQTDFFLETVRKGSLPKEARERSLAAARILQEAKRQIEESIAGGNPDEDKAK